MDDHMDVRLYFHVLFVGLSLLCGTCYVEQLGLLCNL